MVINTIIKDIFAKTLDDVGFDLGGKAITPIKSTHLDAGYTFWNINACERSTIDVSIIS